MEFTEKLLSEIRFDSTVVVLDILIPCILALIFGGIIGFQREKAERPAGLRTHALVCLGSTVFTLISYLGFQSAGSNIDPTRIAAGIVTGIGFIGAGAIFRQGPLIRGVTTAASIWTVASIGMALGAKLYYLALFVTILGFLILSILKFFEDRIINVPKYSLKITTSGKFTGINEIMSMLEKKSVDIKSRKYEFDRENNKKIFTIVFSSKDIYFSTKIIEELSKLKEIEEVNIY
jgi:putative Mg2+ transporter-C (MgtC) family protein